MIQTTTNKSVLGAIYLKIINTINKIQDIYSNGAFDRGKWSNYIEEVNPKLKELCISDLNEAVSTGRVTFEKDFLPILNNVFANEKIRKEAISSFKKVTKCLADKITARFGKSIAVNVVLYLGLCNGAGWVVSIDGKPYCLLGIEKIMELSWHDEHSMLGLVYHELGHVYHDQYGVLEKAFDNNKQQFLWQLLVEGVAMYFEQTLVGDYNYFHQDKNGWKAWCDKNLIQIKTDFYNDLTDMSFENQRYFGDWVFYNEHSDVGYYLGAKFVQFLCLKYSFDDVLSLDIAIVEREYKTFMLA